jgi:zinc protease
MARLPLTAMLAATALLAGCAMPAGKSSPESPAVAEAPKPAAAATGDIFSLPMVQRELDNGLRVIVVRTPQKGLVSLQVPVQTGSRNEVEAGKTGFAHFFEHMMFRGTPEYPPERYTAVIKDAGGDQNAYTDDDLTNYYVNFTPDDLEAILKVEADRFQNLAYTEEQFRTEALAVKGEYLKNYANPLLKGFERLADISFDRHSYGHTTMGVFEDIDDMPNQMAYAQEFFQRWYRPEYTTVIVAGDIDPEATLALVEKYWGKWQRGDYRVEVPVEPARTAPSYEHIEWKGQTLPWLLMGWRAPAFSTTTPDSAALALMGEVHFGDTSPLYQQLVVKERWADQLFYYPARNRDPGLYVVGVRLTDARHAASVVQAIDQTLLAARTRTIEPVLLEQTRSRIKYAFAASLDSASAIGGTLASYVHYERDGGTLNRYYRAFDGVSAADIIAAANRTFTDANRSTVSIATTPALTGANDFAPLDAKVATTGTIPAPAAAVVAPTAPKKTPLEIETEQASMQWALQEAQFSVPLVEQRSDSPLVDVALLFQTGAIADPPGKSGIAVLTAAMVTDGGTLRRNREQIQQALYPFAAPFVAQVDKEMIKLGGTVHRDNLDAWWSIVHELLTEPGFRADDFERIRQQQVNAVRDSLRANNDEELAKELMYEQVYGPDHPYGRLSAGHVADLESITLADVREFYRTRLVRGRLTLALAGGYDDAARDRIWSSTMRLEYIPRNTPPQAVAGAPAAITASRALIVAKETPAVAVSFGFPLDLKRGDPDWIALWLVRSWLGEHRNSAGRLYDRIRETRGMNYGDYAYIEYFPNGMYLMKPLPNYARRNDLFQVWLRPLRDNNDAVFATRTALFELDQLVAHGLSEAQFEASRAFLRKYVAQLTATSALQQGYTLDSRYYQSPEFVEYVRTGLDALTRDEVNAAIRRHLRSGAMQFVFVSRDAQGLADLLASGKPTPVKYNTERPQALLDEDKLIAKWPLGMRKADIRVVKDTDVFE